MVRDSITSLNSQNKAGENTTLNVSVYLPPNYESSNEKHPVICYLKGFHGHDDIPEEFIEILNLAISSGKIRPMIFIIANNLRNYKGLKMDWGRNDSSRFATQCVV